MTQASAAGGSVERFEALYEASPDPWNYASSDYEREKYAATLAAIGPGPFARALEVGCSIGVFTELLAPRCERLVAMDFAPSALALAEERLGERADVELLCGSFPEQAPAGRWDLVVCSEILYYLQRPALREAIAWLEQALSEGTRVVVVSWRGPGETEPLRGDWVHDKLQTRLGPWHDLDARRPSYRLDRFESR